MSNFWRRSRRILQARLERWRVGAGAGDPSAGAPWEGGAEREPSAAPLLDPERARAFRVLGTAPGADSGTLRAAYRDLCRRYHPDRFANEPRKLQLAHELLVEVNRAYALLCREAEAQGPDPLGS